MPTMARVAFFAAIALLGAHLLLVGDEAGDPAGPDRAAGGRSASPRDPMPLRIERQRERVREYHDARRPSVLDSGPERAAKEFERAASLLGTSPVETVAEARAGEAAIQVTEGTADVMRLLRSGGSYSGPLPDELARELYGEGG